MGNAPLTSRTIAAYGEVMMRLSVPGGELLTQADTLRYSFSGTGVNVLAMLARFGHNTKLVTSLPANPQGDAAIGYVRKLGIGTTYVRRAGSHVGMYFLEAGFGPRPSRVTYAGRQDSSFNTAPEGAYDAEALAGENEVLHLCGISLAMNDGVRRQMKTLAKAFKSAGRSVVFDCNYRPVLWGEDGYSRARPHYAELLALADVVLMNERDATQLLGMSSAQVQPRERLVELIPAVADAYGIRTIAGTMRGVNEDYTHTLQGFICKSGNFSFSRKLTFPVYDRIGAGDAFAAGIVHGELQGFSPATTVEFAAASAMLAHTYAGDISLASEADILRTMSKPAGDVER
ncbi:sugar kinase [Paenibacillus athensensis]|uniref:2-dehydro-3-deoxygluconokinase n=1 Tax=Paenibacillus athensensis TaxID=1967502 RepID=A0A4Y8PY78_9BACL|nr:sugar kinase [Paenibacillus athensensis]MCD1258049.1 sugar kinase [Paenibacillus athensensis]